MMNKYKTISFYVIIVILSIVLLIYFFKNNKTNKTNGYMKEIQLIYKSLSNKNYSSSLLDYLKQIFEPEAIKIDFRTIFNTKNKKEIISQGSIWFSKGNLFIRQHGKGELIDNYITTRDFIYSWETGKKEGTKFKRIENDTIHFLIYFLDSSEIKTCIYQSYLSQPENFITKINNNILEIRLRENDGFRGIGIIENPLWLKELYVQIPNNNNEGDAEYVFQFDSPILIDKIPRKVKKIPREIKWKQSDSTIESLMVYL